jgi:predicted ribosomally synthesized peptide with nif11-like leader
MAKESAVQFFTNVSLDEVLQERLKAASDFESLVKVAEEHGYRFTTDELQAVIEEQQSDELFDEQLRSGLYGQGEYGTNGGGDCGSCGGD